MKTQISRQTFVASQRYSGVYQQMGRMITDADWNELTAIVQHRLSDALRDIIGNGVPRDRGLVIETSPGVYELQWGYAYVDGHLAQVVPDHGDSSKAFNLAEQQDFPNMGNLTAGDHRLYLDVWQRTVTHHEDGQLIDPGLKGADTCTRSQTMAQVKACDLSISADDIENNPVINPAIGSIVVSLAVRQGETLRDPCDPCSEELALTENVGNFLFRLEVHDVVFSDDPTPEVIGLTLKWSSENGAEVYAINANPTGFQSNQWSYEFFDGVDNTPANHFRSEKQLGHHLNTNFTPTRGEITQGFSPEATSLSETDDLVRRWDGYIVLERDGNDWSLIEGFDRGRELSTGYGENAHGYTNLDALCHINLDKLVLDFSLDNIVAVAGDYWLAPVRETVHSAGSVLLDNSLAEGIEHHYWALGAVNIDNTGAITLFTPEDSLLCEAFEFPPLTDIRSDDICYIVPSCGDEQQASLRSLLEQQLADEFPDAGTRTRVNIILDTLLCQLSAVSLPIIKSEDLCPTLAAPEIVSVQDALNALCQREVDGCATFTVFPRPGWEQVFDEIADGADATICFREGQYPLTERITIENKGHLRLSGAGEGTHIFANDEVALNFRQCDSVSIQQLYVEARRVGHGRVSPYENINGAVSCYACKNVNVTHSRLRCAAASSPAASCLTISNVGTTSGRASVHDCFLDIGHRQIGLLIMNQAISTINNNRLSVRTRPRSLSLELQLQDRRIASTARKLLINGGEVRNFESSRAAGKTNIHIDGNRQRRIMIDSPIAASTWREEINTTVSNQTLSSNNALLNVAKNIATRVITEPEYRRNIIAFNNWFEALRQQNPSVAYKGIVVGGTHAREVRINDNILDGVQEGIHVGLSDRSSSQTTTRIAGRVVIENNSINVRIPPLVVHRRGGVFVGNCNHLTIKQNHIRVQRYTWSQRTTVEAIRIYGQMGRMIVVQQNYASGCTTGVRLIALNTSQKNFYQWLVTENLMAGVSLLLSSNHSGLITQRDNLR